MTGIFPTAYFGSIAYFQELVRFDEVLLEVHDHFPKQTFRNRCAVNGSQGALRLTLPVEKPSGSKTPTQEVLVSNQQNWRSIHWRTVQSAYASAPYFDHYSSEIKALIDADYPSLIAFNSAITQKLLHFFGVSVQISPTQEYVAEYAGPDFRNRVFDVEQPEGFEAIPYIQVQFEQSQFLPNLSILDLLFCEGPMGRKQLLL